MILLTNNKSIMKQIFFVAFFALCATYVSAQDVIVKKDGSTILSKVLEVNTSDVKYKKFSNKKGPTYTINKSEIMSINYENGEKDLFNGTILETDTKDSKQSLIPSVANQRNSELLSLYNKHYSPSAKMKKKGGKTKNYMLIFWLSPSSIISNDDVEVTLERKINEQSLKYFSWQQLCYVLKITNKSNKTIYVDKGNCFRSDNGGSAYCYYGDSEITTISQSQGGGTSVGLGAVTDAFGIGGLAGAVASGISVGGGRSHSVSKTYSQQRVIAIPPHGNKYLTVPKLANHNNHKGEMVEFAETFDFCQLRASRIKCEGHQILLGNNQFESSFNIQQNLLKKGEVLTYSEQESPYKREYVFIYSKDQNFSTYSMLNMTWYLHEIIGSEKLYWYSSIGLYLYCCDSVYIDGINDYTIEGYYSPEDNHFID